MQFPATKPNQSGFSTVIIVLGLVALAVLAWVMLQQFGSNKSSGTIQKPAIKAKNVIMLTSSDVQLPAVDGFKSGLSEMGYVDGQTINLSLENPKGDKDLLAKSAEKIVAEKPDLIVAFSTSATKAIQLSVADKKIPVLFADVGNFKELGISNLQQPGNHMTGVVSDSVAEGGKRMEIIKEILPNLKTVGVLVNPTHISYPETKRVHDEAGKRLGLNIKYYAASTNSELTAILNKITSEKPDAVMTSPETFLNTNSKLIAQTLRKAKVPTIDYNQGIGINQGFLAVYGLNRVDTGKQGARLADKILKGEDPGNIPIEFATRLVLEINATVAKEENVTLSKSLLLRANSIYNE